MIMLSHVSLSVVPHFTVLVLSAVSTPVFPPVVAFITYCIYFTLEQAEAFKMHANKHKTHARLLFMNLRFWKDIHHLLGFPVPSAYNRSTSRAANS